MGYPSGYAADLPNGYATSRNFKGTPQMTTPDPTLAARLCPRCDKPLIDLMSGVTFGGKEHITCPPPDGWPEREQLITLAEAEAMVRAENEACAKVAQPNGYQPECCRDTMLDAASAIRARVNP